MPELVVPAGELTGRLREGAHERILAASPKSHVGGARIVVERVTIAYRLEPVPPPRDKADR